MMSCPLPLPLPLIPSTLHADFPPVHIGVKQSTSSSVTAVTNHINSNNPNCGILPTTSFLTTTPTNPQTTPIQLNESTTLQQQQSNQLHHISHHHQQQQQQQKQQQHQQQSTVTSAATTTNIQIGQLQHHHQHRNHHQHLHRQQQHLNPTNTIPLCYCGHCCPPQIVNTITPTLILSRYTEINLCDSISLRNHQQTATAAATAAALFTGTSNTTLNHQFNNISPVNIVNGVCSTNQLTYKDIMRGSDELLSQAAVMAPASDNNNQDLATKKAKLEPNTVLGGVGKPSRVIHLRNIPNESNESEVIQLGVPFGRVTNVLVLKGKNQAFLEMADEVSATAMVTCFNSAPPQVRGRIVYVQFSNHRELKTDQSHSIAIQSPASGSPLPVSGTDPTSQAVQNTNTTVTTTQGGPNTVLRVIVESLLYPVTLDILHQIFQRFGKVLKIVTFTKNNSFQALIQYPDAQTAQHAKSILDGQNIYNGCCTLRIDNSKLTALNVKYNNDKSRDFTNPSLPPGEPGADVIPGAGGLVNTNDLLLIAARQRPTLTGDRLVNGLGAPSVLPPFPLGIGAPLASGYSSGIPNLGAFALANTSALNSTTPAALRGFSNVLLVSNLNEEMVTPDALFTLFGVYGDVQRVKILYNKKDSALIQMAEPQQAYLAMNHLDKLRLWGKSIRVMASKHQAVQLPKEGQPDAGLTRDYSQNPLHRFKKPGSKNYQNIYPPSATLHLSNIPSSCTEDDIKEAFSKNNFEVKAFKFFPKDRKMALLQLSSVEEAVLALIKMHNHQLSESNHLRVSFSKSNI